MPGTVNAINPETSIVEPHEQADYAEEVRLSLAFSLTPSFETECSQ
jgi:hypothetical protein